MPRDKATDLERAIGFVLFTLIDCVRQESRDESSPPAQNPRQRLDLVALEGAIQNALVLRQSATHDLDYRDHVVFLLAEIRDSAFLHKR